MKFGGGELRRSSMLAGMNIATRWPSLAPQLDLATELYGDLGTGMVADWLDDQLGLVDNSDFAREFSDHIDLPGVRPLDYAHRLVCTRHGELVGGIRFHGRDVNRPFVEVVAHSFGDIGTLAACVRTEWSAFRPPVMRLRTKPGWIDGGNVVLDHSLHVGRYNQMPAPDSRVRLEVLEDIEEAIAMVANRYEDLAHEHPELASNISPADGDDLRRWHAHDQLRAIRTGDNITVGILAIAPGSVGWLTGDEVNEEVVGALYTGHGYAASAQTAWAAHVATDLDRFLIGTIDRHNHASRRTATRAGRRHLLDDVFVVVDPSPSAVRPQ